MHRKQITSALFLCLAGTLCAQVPPKTYEDVAYDQYERTILDFWQAEGEGPRPLVVHIHGGGWVNGGKGITAPEYFLNSGISVATISYRLTGTDPLPAPVQDAARAIQFLRHKAAVWNIDKAKIVVTGESAGGCSTLWIACHDDLANPDSADPVERESSRVLAAAGIQAQVTIDPILLEDWLGPFARHGMITSAVGELDWDTMLENYDQHQATFEEFSPMNHLTADDPPIYLEYPADLTVPATSYGHAIHHGLFGVKFKEEAEQVGHNQVHSAADERYSSARDFMTKTLLSPPDLIINGSFEMPDIGNNNHSERPAGNTGITGWTIGNGVMLDNNKFGTSSDGDQLLDLQSPSFGGGSAGIISQSFATEVGVNYMLTFDYSAVSSTASMTITYDLGGLDQTLTFSNPIGQVWATETYVFTAASTNTTLTINGDFLGSIAGPGIDNVSVTRTALMPDNLIENGSFESNDLGGSYAELPAANGNLTGWDIAGDLTYEGGITLINGWFGAVATEGDQVLSLQSNSFGGGVSGTIRQSFATEVGQNYMLSFDYSSIDGDAPGQATSITYNLGGSDQTVAFSTGPYGVPPWGTETYVFTATATNTTLTFEGDYLGRWNGPLIDNVSVTRSTLPPDNLIGNGSFEAPLLGVGNFSEQPAGSTFITGGWTVDAAGGGVMLDNNRFGTASDGNQFLDLQSPSFGGGSAGIISQSFATDIGRCYSLSFDYSAVASAADMVLSYGVGGAVQTITFSNPSGQTWVTETFTFTATAASTTLTYEGDFLGSIAGPAIDNVNVSECAGPVVAISSPAFNAAFEVGESVSFDATVADNLDDDGILEAALVWTSDIETRAIGTGANFSTDSLRVGTHTITATSTDSDLNVGADSITITIASVDLGAIWFIGDSITQSLFDGDDTGSPRKSLFDLLVAGNAKFSFTGHLTANVDGLPSSGDTAASNLYHYHSGITGSCIGGNSNNRTDMTANIAIWWNQERLATHRPNAVLIMLGTNDLELDDDVAGAPVRIKTLVDTIWAQVGGGAPAPAIFVAQVTPNTGSAAKAQRVVDFNNALPAIIATLQGEGKDVTLVDQWTRINADIAGLMGDSLHTNAAGNDVLAEQWFDALQSRFGPTPLEAWQITHFGTPNSVAATVDSNPDSDGLPNLLEYALGMNPMVSDQAANKLVAGVITFNKGAGAAAEVAYAIEESEDLGVNDPWEAVEPDVNDGNEISYTLPTDKSAHFVRLKVTQVP
ncbi:MAG: DUF642 domain-containing protein [Opitutae bacterium]|nr:DUF642 domain-containing protein [Opitutae bacterium]